MNGDGVINDQDIVPIGLPGVPPYTFGISAGFSYKGFDLSVLFQGATVATWLPIPCCRLVM
ncbi:hypothetical protein [Niabella hibiscisoli]|uniref:hypothetical protein n=1 Tax=Niabella hibiscisoli TaxID=1825928 RepID=UPI001F10B001|nr:hypothetical protein [Niabella hibiscisoli]MCH5718911.1 hypothetical protein [Niabella hibiscisoli]